MLQCTPLQITKETRFSLQSPDFIGWWQYYIEVNIVKSQQKFLPRMGALPLQLRHLLYVLKVTGLQAASWSLQLTFCGLQVICFCVEHFKYNDLLYRIAFLRTWSDGLRVISYWLQFGDRAVLRLWQHMWLHVAPLFGVGVAKSWLYSDLNSFHSRLTYRIFILSSTVREVRKPRLFLHFTQKFHKPVAVFNICFICRNAIFVNVTCFRNMVAGRSQIIARTTEA